MEKTRTLSLDKAVANEDTDASIRIVIESADDIQQVEGVRCKSLYLELRNDEAIELVRNHHVLRLSIDCSCTSERVERIECDSLERISYKKATTLQCPKLRNLICGKITNVQGIENADLNYIQCTIDSEDELECVKRYTNAELSLKWQMERFELLPRTVRLVARSGNLHLNFDAPHASNLDWVVCDSFEGTHLHSRIRYFWCKNTRNDQDLTCLRSALHVNLSSSTPIKLDVSRLSSCTELALINISASSTLPRKLKKLTTDQVQDMSGTRLSKLVLRKQASPCDFVSHTVSIVEIDSISVSKSDFAGLHALKKIQISSTLPRTKVLNKKEFAKTAERTYTII